MDGSFPYVLGDELGRGSMGVVYRARQRGLEREVALKMVALPPGAEASEAYLARFEREATALAKLSHGHLVKLYDVGQHQGFPYIAMELVCGRSLDQLGAEDPVAVRRRADEIFLQLVSAIAELHRHGLVHRDLKPANVMIDEGGRAVVMDLGLVRDTRGDGVSLTDTGALVGTPLYLAPEVFAGACADERADVWSLACTWYFLHAGRAPFAGETFPDLIRAITAGPLPDLARDLPDMPPERRDVLARLLVRDPAARPRDAGRVLALLEGRSGSGARSRSGRASRPPGRSVPPARSPRALGVFGAGLVVCLAGAGLVAWRGAPPGPAAVRTAAAPAPVTLPTASASAAAGASVLSKLRGMHGFASRLRAGGPTAENARRDLRARTGFLLVATAWLYWFELDRWLTDPKASAEPPEPPSLGYDGIPSSVEISVPFVEEALTYQAGLTSPLVVPMIVDLVALHPQDARGWLFLARIYQLEGLVEDARRLYRVALARRVGSHPRRWSRHSYEALLQGLLLTGADLAVEWPRWVDDHLSSYDDVGDAWNMLRRRFRDSDPALCERLLRAGLRSKSAHAAAVALYRFHRDLARPRAECFPILEAHASGDGAEVVKRVMFEEYIASGDVAGARKVLTQVAGDFQRAFELAVTPPGAALPPPAPDRDTPVDLLARAHLLAERGDAAGVAAMLDPTMKPVIGSWGQMVLGLTLLAFAVERPDLAGRCTSALRDPGSSSGTDAFSLSMWPARGVPPHGRQRAFLEKLAAKLPHAAEIVLAQAQLSSRQGRHDEALDLLERAQAHPNARRFSRNGPLEILARAVVLAPGSAAAQRAVRIGLPRSTNASPLGKQIDAFWERLARGDRAGASAAAQAIWLEEEDIIAAALVPLWVNPPTWPGRAEWIARVRTSWRYKTMHALAPLE